MGMPIEIKTRASVTMATPGTPAAPIEAKVAVKNDAQPIAYDQVNVENLGDEDRRHALVKSGTVHVDNAAEGTHRRRHAIADAQVPFGALHGHR